MMKFNLTIKVRYFSSSKTTGTKGRKRSPDGASTV